MTSKIAQKKTLSFSTVGAHIYTGTHTHCRVFPDQCVRDSAVEYKKKKKRTISPPNPSITDLVAFLNGFNDSSRRRETILFTVHVKHNKKY